MWHRRSRDYNWCGGSEGVKAKLLCACALQMKVISPNSLKPSASFVDIDGVSRHRLALFKAHS